MKSLFKYTLLLLGAVFLTISCESSYDALVEDQLESNPVPEPVSGGDPGTADFSSYAAIGSSVTAGYMDGALYNLGQSNSYPALLSKQFSTASGQDLGFTQPDINSESGFNTVAGTNPVGNIVLGRFKLDASIPAPSPVVTGETIGAYGGDAASLNNFGVPGITVGQLLTGATGGPDDPANPAYSPFYARFASSPGSSTILEDAILAQPTFITLWIGSLDVLGYAATGASNPAYLTSDSDFNTRFNATVGSLMQNTTAKGVVVNIPPLLAAPLFQAVRYNAIPLDETTAAQLNQALDPVNQALQALADNGIQPQEDIDRRKISYSAGQNPILAIDETLDDLEEEFDMLEGAGAITAEQRAALVPYEQSRPLVAGELVLMSAGSLLGKEADGDPDPKDTPIGIVIPLGYDLATGNLSGDRYYLTQDEQLEIETSRATFNGIIATAVSNFPERLALYNTNSATSAFTDLFGLSDGEVGITVNGVDLQPDFSPNGVMSTDGIHPNIRGGAIIANDIIGVINDAFSADIPEVDVLNLPSVQLCNGDCLSEQPGTSAKTW